METCQTTLPGRTLPYLAQRIHGIHEKGLYLVQIRPYLSSLASIGMLGSTFPSNNIVAGTFNETLAGYSQPVSSLRGVDEHGWT